MDVWGVPQIVVRVGYDREKLFGYGIDLGDLQRRLQPGVLRRQTGRKRLQVIRAG